jgi:hypothetical protein
MRIPPNCTGFREGVIIGNVDFPRGYVVVSSEQIGENVEFRLKKAR